MNSKFSVISEEAKKVFPTECRGNEVKEDSFSYGLHEETDGCSISGVGELGEENGGKDGAMINSTTKTKFIEGKSICPREIFDTQREGEEVYMTKIEIEGTSDLESSNGNEKESENLGEFDPETKTSNREIRLSIFEKEVESDLNKGPKTRFRSIEHLETTKGCPDSEEVEPCSKKELTYQCLKCGAIASKEKTAERHRVAHEVGFKCSFCPQAFFMKHTATVHQKLHRGGNLKHVDDFSQCKLCGGSFITLIYLEFHIYELHGEEVLKNHKVMHLGPSSFDDTETKLEEEQETRKRFRCGSCNERFMYSLNLEGHMAFHRESLYCCGLCDSSFSVLDSLLLHLRIHADKYANLSLRKYMETLKGQISRHTSEAMTSEGWSSVRKTIDGEGDISKDLLYDSQTGNRKGFHFVSHNRKVVKLPSNHCLCENGFDSFACTKGSVKERSTSGFSLGTFQKYRSNSSQHDSYLNPFLFHFLPGGKHANQLEGRTDNLPSS